MLPLFIIFAIVVGSIFMLVGILYLYFQAGSMGLAAFLEVPLERDVQLWLFAAFFLAFAIKVPVFPLHTWLPDAHVAAPTAGSVILAGVLLKMGTYGMLRFAMPLFPEGVAYFAPAISILAVIGEEGLVVLRGNLADSAVVLRGVLKVGADDRWLVKREALRRVKNRFDAEKIEIPFPHVTLYQGEPDSAGG